MRQLDEAERLAERLGDQRRLGHVLCPLARNRWQRADYARAIDAGRRARTIAEAVDDVGLSAMATFYLGIVHHTLGDYGAARDLQRRVVALLPAGLARQRFGFPYLAAVFARAWLGWCEAEMGEFDEGLARTKEAVALAEEADQPWDCMVAHWAVGLLHLARGEYPEATERFETSLAICQGRDVPRWYTTIASHLGYACALSGSAGRAAALIEDALGHDSKVSAHHARLLTHLGEAYLLAGRVAEATAVTTRALDLARERGERGWQAWCLRLLGLVSSQAGGPHVQEAEEQLRQAISLATTLGMRPLVAHCHLGLGRHYQQRGPCELAAEPLSVAASMYREMAMRWWLDKAEHELLALGG